MENAGTTGSIFNIQHFSIHDGPGVRSTVFMQGCPLNCLWCHNPESGVPRAFIARDMRKCVDCGACARACPQGCAEPGKAADRVEQNLCVCCGTCVSVCPTEALRVIGREVTVAEIVADVIRDKPYFEHSGGGVTFSGGEPTVQPDFLLAALKAFGEQGVHRVIETCGYADTKLFEKLMRHTELFLFDCKETDDTRHRALTGRSNDRILYNLHYLHDHGARVLLRCPIIPGLNDREEHFAALAALTRKLPNLEGIELLPYHDLGVAKVASMGLKPQNAYRIPTKEVIEGWKKSFVARNVHVLV